MIYPSKMNNDNGLNITEAMMPKIVHDQTTKQWVAVWHEIFAGSNFREIRRFSIDPRK